MLTQQSETACDERELLLSYRPWLRKLATQMTYAARAEDLAQEGWIEIWRAIKLYDGSAPLDWWLKRKAHGRMLTVIRNWTANKQVFFDVVPDVTELIELTAEIGEVELAYHYGEILKALNRLTDRQREYVVLRFWGGYNYPELREHFGYEPQGLWRQGKKKLKEDLVHLGG